ncbi:MAG: hypothetical protein QXO16_05635 [Archaeoglobaceae archaeon]
MMMRIAKFLKFEAFFVVARYSWEQRNAIVLLHPEFAKKSGIKSGDVVLISKGERSLKFRVKLWDTAPENGGIIPNSIFANYLTDFQNFKKFSAYVEIAEGEESKVEDIIKTITEKK